MSGAYQEYAEETVGQYDWPIPRHAYLLSYFLIVGMTAIWAWQFMTNRIADWGLSAKALAEGRFETIPLHIITHGPIFHIAMNMYALHVIGPRVIARLGSPRRAAGAFLLLFFLSGLAGSTFFSRSTCRAAFRWLAHPGRFTASSACLSVSRRRATR